MPSISSIRALSLLVSVSGVLIGLPFYSAQAASNPLVPTATEQAELDKYPAYSGPINVLEVNAGGAIQKFFNQNDGKIVYLDAYIIRYIPIDPVYIDDPNIRASTDRFKNSVFTKCWPDQKADYKGILNFGEEGFPLPKDEADIEAGCASRIRFDLPNLKDSASIPTSFGDNKIQVYVTGFYSIAKSTLDNGKTLYTLKPEPEVPFDTRLVFDKHKAKTHPDAQLSLQKAEDKEKTK